MFAVALCTGCMEQNFKRNIMIGPVLLSWEESIELARRYGYLTTFDSVEICTAGPVYRVIVGKDAGNTQKIIWISDKIKKVVNLEDGVSKEYVVRVLEQNGYRVNPQNLQVQYIPAKSKLRSIASLRNQSSGVFWTYRCNESCTIFIDFYSGRMLAAPR